MNTKTNLGRIDISNTTIANLASQAELECYRLVGMSARNIKDGNADLLSPGSSERDVEIRLKNDEITIDLYVIIKYVIRISEVAYNIIAAMKFRVEKALSIPVSEVNVQVQGLRFSQKD